MSHAKITRRGFLAASASTLASPALARKWEAPPEWEPRVVKIRSGYAPGEIHVEPSRYRLYLTLDDETAMRYVVGVGRAGRYHTGTYRVGKKRKWPSWTPTAGMIAREPEKYLRYADGVAGGPDNPLGARGIYLYKPRGGDSLLRIHGTPEPWTVGNSVSNGCVRLMNDHISDLYERIGLGAKVILHPKAA